MTDKTHTRREFLGVGSTTIGLISVSNVLKGDVDSPKNTGVEDLTVSVQNSVFYNQYPEKPMLLSEDRHKYVFLTVPSLEDMAWETVPHVHEWGFEARGGRRFSASPFVDGVSIDNIARAQRYRRGYAKYRVASNRPIHTTQGRSAGKGRPANSLREIAENRDDVSVDLVGKGTLVMKLPKRAAVPGGRVVGDPSESNNRFEGKVPRRNGDNRFGVPSFEVSVLNQAEEFSENQPGEFSFEVTNTSSSEGVFRATWRHPNYGTSHKLQEPLSPGETKDLTVYLRVDRYGNGTVGNKPFILDYGTDTIEVLATKV